MSLKKQLVAYFEDIMREIKKVDWPHKNVVLKSTWIILLIIVIFSILITCTDFVCSFVMTVLQQ